MSERGRVQASGGRGTKHGWDVRQGVSRCQPRARSPPPRGGGVCAPRQVRPGRRVSRTVGAPAGTPASARRRRGQQPPAAYLLRACRRREAGQHTVGQQLPPSAACTPATHACVAAHAASRLQPSGQASTQGMHAAAARPAAETRRCSGTQHTHWHQIPGPPSRTAAQRRCRPQRSRQTRRLPHSGPSVAKRGGRSGMAIMRGHSARGAAGTLHGCPGPPAGAAHRRLLPRAGGAAAAAPRFVPAAPLNQGLLFCSVPD